jgi:hypothetical protein
MADEQDDGHPDEKELHDKLWSDLSDEEKDLYIRLLWNDGYSDNAIGAFFDTSKNAVVGYRHSKLKDLHSRGRDREKVKRYLSKARFSELLELHRMRELQAQGVVVSGPVSAEFTGPQAVVPIESITTCRWPLTTSRSVKNLKFCEKPIVPGHQLCEEHLAFVRRRKR